MKLIQSKLKNSQGRTVSLFPYIAFSHAGVIALNVAAVQLLGAGDADRVYIDFFFDDAHPKDRYISIGRYDNKDSVCFRAKRGKDGRINRYAHMNKEYSKEIAYVLGMSLPMRFRIAEQPAEGSRVHAIITAQNLIYK